MRQMSPVTLGIVFNIGQGFGNVSGQSDFLPRAATGTEVERPLGISLPSHRLEFPAGFNFLHFYFIVAVGQAAFFVIFVEFSQSLAIQFNA